MNLTRLLPATALVCLLGALPASAQGPKASPGMTHVSNTPYELRWEAAAPNGTDMEFATITVKAPTPAVAPVTPPAVVPPVKKPTSKKKKASRYTKCVRKARKLKGKRRKAALKRCAKLKKRKSSIRAKRSMADVDPVAPGAQRTFMFAGTYTNGLQIFDVSVPGEPKLVTAYDCGLSQGDVQVFQRPDLGGRWFVAYAADDGYSFMSDSKCSTEAAALGQDASAGSGTFLIDVTDPAKPFTVSYIHFEKGSHNQTVHPSGKYLYNSNSDLATDLDPGIEIADISDITKPKEVARLPITPLPGLGSDSHDISFNADGTRAYSAAVSQGLIIDTTDPAKPSIISRIYDPAVNVWHQAEIVEAEVPGLGKRSILIGEDEFAGATGTGECPSGGLHMYDITGPLEAAPVKLGLFNIPDARPVDTPGGRSCTAHVFQLHREQNIMLLGWYAAGTHVLDITELAGVAFGANGVGMKSLGYGYFDDSDVWAAKAPFVRRDEAFFIYANDHARGLDVWRFDPKAAGATRSVRFIPAGQEPAARQERHQLGFRCLLSG